MVRIDPRTITATTHSAHTLLTVYTFPEISSWRQNSEGTGHSMNPLYPGTYSAPPFSGQLYQYVWPPFGMIPNCRAETKKTAYKMMRMGMKKGGVSV